MTEIRNWNQNWTRAEAHVAAYREELNNAKFVEALRSPNYAYSRQRGNGAMAFVTIYHRDHTSPTGVLAAAQCGNIEFACKAMREIVNNSPLSPTEGLQSSGARLY